MKKGKQAELGEEMGMGEKKGLQMAGRQQIVVGTMGSPSEANRVQV